MENKKEEKKEGSSFVFKAISMITLMLAFTILLEHTYDEFIRRSSNTVVGVSVYSEETLEVEDAFANLSEEETRRLIEEVTSNE